jgi:MFS transporter, OFA family, oxalate/formate antiporter
MAQRGLSAQTAATHEAAARQKPWAAIAAATMLNLPMGTIYAFSVFLKPLEEMLGATRSELATVFALATIGFCAGMNIAPYLFRLVRFGPLVLLCTLGGAAGIALSAAATNLLQLAIGYGALFGVCGGAAYIIVQQALNQLDWKRRGLVNGYVVSLYPLGAMIAAPLFGWALARWDVRVTLGGLAVAIFVSGLLTVALSAYAGLRLTTTAATVSTGPVGDRRMIFWQMFFIFFLAAAAGLMVLSQAAAMVRAYGGSLALSLWATTAITGTIAFARLTGGWLVDRFAIPTVMAAAQAFALAGAIVLTLWPSAEMATVTLCMIGMGYGFISGAVAAAIGVYWPQADFGRIASRIYIAWCIAAVSLPVLAGHLFDLTGGYGTAIIIAGAGNLIAVAVALTLPRRAAAA